MNRLIILFLSLSIFSTALYAQSDIIRKSYDDLNKTTVKLTPIIDGVPCSGYLPMRLTLKNGTPSEKIWTLNFRSTFLDNYSHRGNNEGTNLTSDFSYSCPPESSKTYDLLVPVVTVIESGHNPSETSLTTTLRSDDDIENDHIRSSYAKDQPATLLSTKLYTEHISSLNTLTTSSSSYMRGSQTYASQFTPSIMSEDWRAYSGYDVLVCTDLDWMEMSAGARNALLEWNRLGGKILIYKLNSASNFKSLNIDESENNTGSASIDRSFGNVQLVPLADIKSLDVSALNAMIKDSTIVNNKHNIINDSYSGYSGAAWALQKTLGNLSFSPMYLIIILIVFGILVGPVNLFVFAKAGQRHRLFVTTPIIALGASLLLVIIIIVQDGFGGHGQRVQLIEVRADANENKAYVWQEQVTRTGVILGSSFETSSPAYFTPVPLSESHFSRVTQENHGGDTNHIASHGEKGLAGSGDWFQSRSVHGHYLECVIPTRAKITLKSNEGAPMINSSFDHNIQALLYLDEAGQAWQTMDLAAGDTKKLTPVDAAEFSSLVSEYYDLMTPKLQREFDTLRKRKNHFIALTPDAPAISTLESINWTSTKSIITGPVVK